MILKGIFNPFKKLLKVSIFEYKIADKKKKNVEKEGSILPILFIATRCARALARVCVCVLSLIHI